MMLHIFDPDFNLVGMLDNYISLQWQEDYYDRGSFTLVCIDSKQNVDLLQMGNYIYKSGKNTAMIIRYTKYNSDEGTLEINGYTTLDLLRHRIVYPVQAVTNVETGMYDLAEKFLSGSYSERNLKSFTTKRKLEGTDGLPYKHETRFLGTNLLEAISTLGQESEYGCYMDFDWRNKRHIFTVYQGKNRIFGQKENTPAIFSAEFGNLRDTIIIDDMSIFKNVAYVVGEDRDGGKEPLSVVVGNASGIDRYELFVEAKDLKQNYKDENDGEVNLSDNDYKAVLTARGIEKLNEQLRARSFSGEVEAYRFGTDYYLGDLISCKSEKYNVRIDARIMQYTEVTEENMTKLSLSLGTPEITLLQEVKTWL